MLVNFLLIFLFFLFILLSSIEFYWDYSAFLLSESFLNLPLNLHFLFYFIFFLIFIYVSAWVMFLFFIWGECIFLVSVKGLRNLSHNLLVVFLYALLFCFFYNFFLKLSLWWIRLKKRYRGRTVSDYSFFTHFFFFKDDRTPYFSVYNDFRKVLFNNYFFYFYLNFFLLYFLRYSFLLILIPFYYFFFTLRYIFLRYFFFFYFILALIFIFFIYYFRLIIFFFLGRAWKLWVNHFFDETGKWGRLGVSLFAFRDFFSIRSIKRIRFGRRKFYNFFLSFKGLFFLENKFFSAYFLKYQLELFSYYLFFFFYSLALVFFRLLFFLSNFWIVFFFVKYSLYLLDRWFFSFFFFNLKSLFFLFLNFFYFFWVFLRVSVFKSLFFYDKIINFIIFAFFTFFNILWATFIFFYTTIINFFSFFIFQFWKIRKFWLLLLFFWVLIYLNSELVVFFNYFFTYWKLDNLLNYFWGEGMGGTRDKIKIFSTYFINNKDYFIPYSGWDFFSVFKDFINYSFNYFIISIQPWELLSFFQTSAWIWIIYYFFYSHYLFLYIFYFVVLEIPLLFLCWDFFFSLVSFFFLGVKSSMKDLSTYFFITLGFPAYYIWLFTIISPSSLKLFFEELFCFKAGEFLAFLYEQSLFYGVFFYRGAWFSDINSFFNLTWKLSFNYPITTFILPYNDYFLEESEELLLECESYDPWYQTSGFYSRVSFDDYAFISQEALYHKRDYHVSPIKGFKLHNIEESLKLSDKVKIDIMFNFFQERYRKSEAYSLSVLDENNYTFKYLIFSTFNDSFFHLADISALRRKRRRKAKLIRTIMLTKFNIISFLLVTFLFFLFFFFLFIFFSGFKRFLSLDSVTLYDPQALWRKHLNDFKEQKTWIYSIIFFFDKKNEIYRFQSLLNWYYQKFSSGFSFWEFFYRVRVTGSFFLSQEPRKIWIRTYNQLSINLNYSHLHLLFLSKYIVFKKGGVFDRLHNSAFYNLASNNWLSEYFYEICCEWDKVKAFSNLNFENVSCFETLSLLSLWDFFSAEYYVNRLDKSGNEFIFSPLAPYSSLNFYWSLVPAYFRQFNLSTYIKRFTSFFWFEISENISLSMTLHLLFEFSFIDIFEPEDDLSFEGFPEAEYFFDNSNKNLTWVELAFFSQYYHDFISLEGMDFFEFSHFLWDGTSYNIDREIGAEEEAEEDKEEEEEPLELEEESYLYWVWDYNMYDIEQVDYFMWNEVEFFLQDYINKVLYSAWPREINWVNYMVERGKIDEDIPDYLSWGKAELETEDYTNLFDDNYCNENYYSYEARAVEFFLDYFNWLDYKIFSGSLPWWSWHKDYWYLDFIAYDSLNGKSYFNNQDDSELFPFFFYWFFIFVFCILHFIVWMSYLHWMPFLKYFFSYSLMSFLSYYFFDYSYRLDIAFYAEFVRDIVFYDREDVPSLNYFAEESAYFTQSYPLVEMAYSSSHLADPVDWLISSFEVLFRCNMKILNYKASTVFLLILFYLLSFWVIFSTHQEYIMNKYVLYDSSYLFRSFNWFNLKLFSKKNFFYGITSKI